MAKLRFGIKTAPQHTTYDAMLEVWQEADATPVFEHAWLFDHFAPIGGLISMGRAWRAGRCWRPLPRRPSASGSA